MSIKFNKKSLKRLSDPDKLDKYIRVATPAAWLILAAVVLVIIGIVVWTVLCDVEGDSIMNALFSS